MGVTWWPHTCSQYAFIGLLSIILIFTDHASLNHHLLAQRLAISDVDPCKVHHLPGKVNKCFNKSEMYKSKEYLDAHFKLVFVVKVFVPFLLISTLSKN